jgi:putative ABC transport system permease protein
MTTMTRMVEDERTQIGVLKALGYSDGAVMAKYLFYSGSAAVGGAVFGYVVGNLLFPKVIWIGYNMLYDFAKLTYVWDIKIGIISIAAAVLCSMGATYFSCAAQFHSSPAMLIRPKAPKSGKRILLEKVGFIWKNLSFLRKVSIRNVFRYKKRFVMMIMGIGGCSALVVTALGLKDSFSDIVSAQFREIAVYDMSVTLGEPADDKMIDKLADEFEKYFDSYAFLNSSTMELESDNANKSANIIIPENADEITEQYHFLDSKNKAALPYPKEGEIILTKRLAKVLGVKKGDIITITDDDFHTMTVTVSGICKNYVFNYAFIAKETYMDAVGHEPEYRTVYASLKDGMGPHQTAADMLALDDISSAYVNADTQEQFNNMISSINYVVIMVIVLAAALAFVVLYNLTNINITERIREIATIKVLGFYSGETAAYVFRENFILTGIGAVLGLGLGKLLHVFIMDCINVEAVSFDSYITPLSYLLSVILTFVFAVIVNFFMLFKLKKINMAESLKSVE